LGQHSVLYGRDGSGSAYCGERAREVKVLRDPQIRAAIVDREIELCSFGALRGLNLAP